MRKPLQDARPRDMAGTARGRTIPAPVGGWNTRDPISGMKETDAVVLDNLFPREGQVELRGGSISWATGITGDVRSLFQYTPSGTPHEYYAISNAGIYEITGGGAATLVKAVTNGYMHGTTLINSAGDDFYWLANGTDDVVLYNGTTWTSLNALSTPAITGVSSSALVYPWLHKHRIFCIEKESMNVWYFPVDSIAGVATVYPLGNLFRRGGSLNSGVSWTLDSGAGPDDLFVVITTEGEIAVYKGINPSSASTWEIVGVWYVGKPLSRRCFFKIGGEVGVLVENGVFFLSKLLQTGEANFAGALSNKIQTAFSTITSLLGTVTEGWEGCVYPQYDAMLVNIPEQSQQYVMNTVTGAWCSFSGWAASCFLSTSDGLFFGKTDGTVAVAWDGTQRADDGSDIIGEVITSWSYFQSRGTLKHITLFRPLLAYNGAVELRWGIEADFANVIPLTSIYPRSAPLNITLWDSALWDIAIWPQDLIRHLSWRNAANVPGYAHALHLQIATNDSSLAWSGTDYHYHIGGLI
jgi:hypothetical protein